MKIVKITEKTLVADEDGLYKVYCQALFGNTYRYIVIYFGSLEEAQAAKEGDNLDMEKVKFGFRTIYNVK